MIEQAKKSLREWKRKWKGFRNQKGRRFVWIPFPHGLGTSDHCCFISLLKSFGMAWCVYHANGSLGNDGGLVGMHSVNGLPPCELEDLQIKAFYSV